MLEEKPFITLSEPACGSGTMVLAFVNEMMKENYNPATALWVQCIDIDETSAYMCYLQLALWNVPAQVIIGDSLAMDFKRVLYTPAHYMWNWEYKLAGREDRGDPSDVEPTDIPPPHDPSPNIQFNFGF
jgi:hypothetical protein